MPCGCEGHADNAELCQYPKARALLDEALALIKERLDLDTEGFWECPCDYCKKGRSILHRAGVNP
jgi:hypothetical protein